MFKTLKKGFFPFLIAFSALSVSASAAFYSVSGLSKLFAGASFEVIIMAGSLEFSKLVIASLLYQYWDTINKWLRTYLTIAAVTLVLITSMGIYGFLSAAYQETYQKLVVQQNEIEFLDNKAQFYEDDVTRYDQELERISANIATLSNARSQQIQVRDTSVVGGVRTTISTSELRLAQSRINVEEENRRNVQAKREVAADSLQNIKLKILDIQNQSDTVGELGPLQYLSGLTGTPMDKIINILLLVIIFVFDPLAISLVVAANFAFDKAFPKRPEDELIGPDLGNSVWDDVDENDYEAEEDDYYDEGYDEATWRAEGIADEPATTKPPFEVSVDKESAKAWYDLADQLAKDSVEVEDEDLPRDYELEYEEPNYDHLKDHVDMKEEQMQDTAFADFQNKMDENDEKFKEELEEWKNKKWEVEDTAGNVEVYGDEEAEEDEELETDRFDEFPNDNNPTSVAAVVKDLPNDFGTYPKTVQKIETPHLPKETTTTTTLPPEARGFTPPVEEVEEIDEDELFDAAMRKKAEEDMKDFLNKKDDKQN